MILDPLYYFYNRVRKNITKRVSHGHGFSAQKVQLQLCAFRKVCFDTNQDPYIWLPLSDGARR